MEFSGSVHGAAVHRVSRGSLVQHGHDEVNEEHRLIDRAPFAPARRPSLRGRSACLVRRVSQLSCKMHDDPRNAVQAASGSWKNEHGGCAPDCSELRTPIPSRI